VGFVFALDWLSEGAVLEVVAIVDEVGEDVTAVGGSILDIQYGSARSRARIIGKLLIE
jgi:hypothetical protein